MKHIPGYLRAIKDEETRKVIKYTLMHEASIRLVICEQIRFAYDMVEELPDSHTKKALIDQLIDIFGTAKKMNSRLAWYRRHYGGETGNSGKSIPMLFATRRRKRMRGARPI